MRAGKLRHKVTIQKPIRQANSYGEELPNWESVLDCYVSLEPLKASERFRAEQNEQTTTHLVTARYSDAITPDCRLMLDDAARGKRFFHIASVINKDERGAELELICTEIVVNGSA